SHQAIIDKKKRKEWEKWYKVEAVLGKFGRKEGQAKAQYRQFLLDGLKRNENPLKGAHFGYILGSENLVKWVQKTFLDEKADRELKGIKEVRAVVKPEEIIEASVKVMETTRDEILKPKRGREVQNPARGIAIYLIQKYCGITQRELGQMFGGITNVGISMAVKRFKEFYERGNLQREVREIENSLIVKT
ncbi:MAG: hypothetical protein ACYC5N_11885, partial [Endomicrobiales bacterium]